MNNLLTKYGPVYDTDDGGGGGTPASDPKPEPKTSANKDTANYAELYADLSQKVETDYVSRKSYAALQTKLTKSQEARAELTQQMDELKGRVDSLSALETEKTELTSQLEQASNEHQTTKNQLGRLQLIVKEYPQLISFESEGLLPQVSLEELPSKLDAFAKAVGERQVDLRHEEIDGTSIDPKRKDEKDTKADSQALLKEAIDLQLKGDLSGYEEKYLEYQRSLGIDPGTGLVNIIS